jgi:hypothetical protein
MVYTNNVLNLVLCLIPQFSSPIPSNQHITLGMPRAMPRPFWHQHNKQEHSSTNAESIQTYFGVTLCDSTPLDVSSQVISCILLPSVDTKQLFACSLRVIGWVS